MKNLYFAVFHTDLLVGDPSLHSVNAELASETISYSGLQISAVYRMYACVAIFIHIRVQHTTILLISIITYFA